MRVSGIAWPFDVRNSCSQKLLLALLSLHSRCKNRRLRSRLLSYFLAVANSTTINFILFVLTIWKNAFPFLYYWTKLRRSYVFDVFLLERGFYNRGYKLWILLRTDPVAASVSFPAEIKQIEECGAFGAFLSVLFVLLTIILVCFLLGLLPFCCAIWCSNKFVTEFHSTPIRLIDQLYMMWSA